MQTNNCEHWSVGISDFIPLPLPLLQAGDLGGEVAAGALGLEVAVDVELVGAVAFLEDI